MINKTIINGIIIGGILGILLGAGFIFNEMQGAREFCTLVGENHSLEYDSFQFKHYCGDKQVHKYPKGWDFDRETVPWLVYLP